MMDEQLIDEVAQHGVIYNRQKYYLNGGANGGKYETKDEAWQLIAMKLRTDVDTCKKRWKYLRERYVSQRKQGDPPVYEHLSRPYLEKMKFLDQHIQPRKSYRHVPNFLTSPQSANSSSYNEYQVDKSNGSMKNVAQFNSSGQSHHYHQPDQQHAMSALSTAAASALENVNGQVKIEADQVFRDFAAAVASQQLQHISQSQMQQQAAAVAAVMADSSQGYQDQYKDGSVVVNGVQTSAGSLTSTSSSMKSPLSSPLQGIGAGTHHPQQQQQHQQQQQQQQQQSQQQSPVSGQQLPVVHSSSSAAGGSISASSNLQMHPSNVYNPKGDDLDSSASSNFHMKKPRVQLNGSTHNQMTSNGSHFGNDSDDDSDDNSHDLMEPQVLMQNDNHYSNSMNMQRGNGNGNSSGSNSGSNNTSGNSANNSHNNQQPQQQQHQNMFPSNTDFLFQLYQQFPHQATSSHPSNFGKFQAPPNHPGVQRLSEHLLGELVTTELLKMNKERKKSAQKRILEILFFDD